MSDQNKAVISAINGPVIRGAHLQGFAVHEMVRVGEDGRLGEIISLDGTDAVIQVYEQTEGLKVGDPIGSTGMPLSVRLGPGLLTNMFDGIERPLERIEDDYGSFMPTGVQMEALSTERTWEMHFTIKEGDAVTAGQIIATTQETSLIEHRVMVPPQISGDVVSCGRDGSYRLEDVLATVRDANGVLHELKMVQEWPVRRPRPTKVRQATNELLVTGQRVLDVFFPIAKGGTVAIPGGFGTGKTMLQHQIAKFCDAEVIVYIGCGERGNEMTDVLDSFPTLIDPHTGENLMNRTILIANTSNMPVAAREASIYTGITMAEYYRDMGYHVALMADSTSRWAEALREISGRLEEMPAEEGYPAYLSSRIAQFYERAGRVETLSGAKGSVTLIGAVSPAGGDFSEPVTEATKRYVKTFLGLDKELAYSRHYPSINWMNSYSGYTTLLANDYMDKLDVDVMALRNKMLNLLMEESRLNDIVSLVGADVLPDDQRLILDIARVIRVGYLQQNSFDPIDTYVPLEKQVKMLQIIDHLYERCNELVEAHVPLRIVHDDAIFDEVIMMKYHIPNDDPEALEALLEAIDARYDAIKMENQSEAS
ncbi:MAG: V-type ATP synthase subunit A [Peptoniphilaceae bacterium]|nr:V-type ATP synthase subunit A [Peptoniphilaceae bacterium]MDY6085137.1 V-type ATP synthase subunit A [Peptoniphilaceae bacterium]